MKNKSLLEGMSGWTQFFFFLFLSFTGFLFGSLIMLLSIDIKEMETSARVMRMAQMISQIFLFIVPSLAFALICHEKPNIYLKIDKRANILILALGIVSIFAIQPLIDFIAYYNQHLSLPDSMAFLEEKMREGELAAKKTVDLLFADKSIAGLIFNLLVMAVVAGLAEELFFRGCLQQIMYKISKNEHVAIWVTAVIFSAIHFQFFGFFPRVLLGALLGYLFVWSRNLWVPIIVHTLNNAASVIIAYIYYGTPEYESLSEAGLGRNIWYIVLSIAITFILMIVIYKRREKGTGNP